MTSYDGADTRSLVIASDYRVPDPARVPRLLEKRKAALAEIGAHHVFVHASTNDPGRVLVSIVVHNHEPIVDLLRSRVFFEWFDAVGVTDIPAVFAGALVDGVSLVDSTKPAPPSVVVAAMTSVRDVAKLVEHVHLALDRFEAAGIEKTWIFQAFDDAREVMILQQIDNEDSARRWIDHPDAAAEWMERAGMGAYPPLFVGKFLHMMRIDENL
ncbi:MAG: fatty-acid--CoA ligase [Mycobacterium sp.]